MAEDPDYLAEQVARFYDSLDSVTRAVRRSAVRRKLQGLCIVFKHISTKIGRGRAMVAQPPRPGLDYSQSGLDCLTLAESGVDAKQVWGLFQKKTGQKVGYCRMK